MPKPARRVLLAGPPAAGKTCVAQCLQAALAGCEYLGLDTQVQALCAERGHTGPLPDKMVDEAVLRLLSSLPDAPSAIVELPHHDYIALLAAGILDLEQYDCVAVVTAPYRALREREATRQHGVPLQYIARSVGGSEALCAWLSDSGVPFLRFDSQLTEARYISECIIDFLRRFESATLSRLAVGPRPLSPYLGGHFQDQVEWDEDFIQMIAQHFDVATALDIGCGIGLTLDRFRAIGIEAWGLEGNVAVLDGPAINRQRLLVADFTKQWVEWPVKGDLTWCVEVLEHVPRAGEANVLATIAQNTRRLAFVAAAKPGQPGYHHVNCQPQSYWIERLRGYGLSYLTDTPRFLRDLTDEGAFGMNVFKDNGMLFEVCG